MISTKGRYALRVIIDLACQPDSQFIPLNTIAERQCISEKYLESIMAKLVKANLVKSLRGKSGGYMLTRPPESYTIYEILTAAEGDLASVSCLTEEQRGCDRSKHCPTLMIWQGLDLVTQDYLKSITIADVCAQYENDPPSSDSQDQ